MTAGEGFDLNIVAVPPPQSLQTNKKKKKNNRYEKRRQHSQRARQQKAESATVEKTNNEKKQTNRESDSSADTPKQLDASTPEKSDGNVSNDKQMREDFHTTKAETNDEVPSKGNSPTMQRKVEHPVATAPVATPTPPETKPSKKKHRSLDDDEERAKYLAEFHARPMELDRRSGARSSTVVLSKESTHIFDDDTHTNDWNSLGLHPRLIQTIQSPQFNSLKQPTTIQSRTIRAFREASIKKKNVLIHSETGSGKTLAYLLPILQSIAFGSSNTDIDSPANRIPRADMGCKCIILCPTRELASQTLQAVETLCQANFAGWIVPGGLLGGDKRHAEKSRLRKGLAIVVATPGRLLDHLHKTQSLAMSLKGGKFQWLVLDEADRLLDMGLGDQVRQIVQWIRANEASKQKNTEPWWRSVLVSATVTSSVQALAKERMLCGNQEWIWVKGDNGEHKNKIANITRCSPEDHMNDNVSSVPSAHGEATSENYSSSTPRQLAQFHLTVTAKLRLATLVAFLVQRISHGDRTVVFMGTCATVDYHYELFHALKESLWDGETVDDSEASTGLFGKKARVYRLHGNVPHAKRVQTMEEFSKNNDAMKKSAAILLTTDVAARGLNLDSIDWTVQYDPPCEIADYVHRVGRGARAGKAGQSLLFLLPSERKYLEVLEAKGISNLNPLSLSSLLNQAAGTCTEWTKAGMEHGGGGISKKPHGSLSGGKNSRSGEFFCFEVQRRLEDCVVEDDNKARKAWKEKQQEQRKRKAGKTSSKDGKKEGQLLTLARDAFLSFLRAYPTKKESIVRSIFSSRALHLGHVAKSFALKEPPTSVVSKTKSKKQQLQEESQDVQANLPRSLEFTEAPFDMDDILAQVERREKTGFSGYVDDDEEKHRSNKRQKMGKAMTAKALLLANAAKMQNNLMDAM
ncbi:inducible ATP-independent RNA helicase [Nitzschia inconspicua]|uniref:ATP-dependent RNA helicase n=1 Tax=Nitzschia inconspicua TaxID=303405 RepID=A0A9K3LT89_9STRA|nr:inducible ATP-independent RNA helicase [Nitzschia inconspicua]